MANEIRSDRIARYLAKIAPECEVETLDEMVQRMTGMVDGDGVVVMQGLPEICRSWDVPYGKVLLWLMSDEKRYELYKRALEVQAHALVSETVGIADEGVDTQRDKLRIETRLKVAEKHAPGMYGKAEGGASGITVVVNRNAGFSDKGNPSVVGAPTPLCDGVSIECDGKNLTIN